MNLVAICSQYEQHNYQKGLRYYNAKVYVRYININSLIGLDSSSYSSQLDTSALHHYYSFLQKETSDHSTLDLI